MRRMLRSPCAGAQMTCRAAPASSFCLVTVNKVFPGPAETGLRRLVMDRSAVTGGWRMAASVLGLVLTGSVSVGLCISCAALAGSGRMNFSGAVVEPTCSSQAVEWTAEALPGGWIPHVACASPAAPDRQQTGAYSLRITPLPAGSERGLPATTATRARARSTGPAAKMLTRTYE